MGMAKNSQMTSWEKITWHGKKKRKRKKKMKKNDDNKQR